MMKSSNIKGGPIPDLSNRFDTSTIFTDIWDFFDIDIPSIHDIEYLVS